MIRHLTVLYDPDCPMCRAARAWLDRQRQIVPLRFLPAGSHEAWRAYPALDHEATLRDVTVVDDNGGVYVADDAWLICLWALDRYRATAVRFAAPEMRPYARRAVVAATAVRRWTSQRPRYGVDCDDSCDTA
jgi:predicted DCC family thiol-disulfide oxidoreductase YuxK